jgi:hypothetical protein
MDNQTLTSGGVASGTWQMADAQHGPSWRSQPRVLQGERSEPALFTAAIFDFSFKSSSVQDALISFFFFFC